MEIWKQVKKTGRSSWELSSEGRIRINGVIKNRAINGKGYKMFLGKKIHQWMGLLFIPNPENKPEINHKNGIKSDNRVENLEWATRSENTKHAIDTGLIDKERLISLCKKNAEKAKGVKRSQEVKNKISESTRGIKNPRAKLDENKMQEILRLKKLRYSQTKIANEMGVSVSLVCKFLNNKTYQ